MSYVEDIRSGQVDSGQEKIIRRIDFRMADRDGRHLIEAQTRCGEAVVHHECAEFRASIVLAGGESLQLNAGHRRSISQDAGRRIVGEADPEYPVGHVISLMFGYQRSAILLLDYGCRGVFGDGYQK